MTGSATDVFLGKGSGSVSAVGSASNNFEYTIDGAQAEADPKNTPALIVGFAIEAGQHTLAFTNSGGQITISYFQIPGDQKATTSSPGQTSMISLSQAPPDKPSTKDNSTPTTTISSTRDSQSLAGTSTATGLGLHWHNPQSARRGEQCLQLRKRAGKLEWEPGPQ